MNNRGKLKIFSMHLQMQQQQYLYRENELSNYGGHQRNSEPTVELKKIAFPNFICIWYGPKNRMMSKLWICHRIRKSYDDGVLLLLLQLIACLLFSLYKTGTK